MIFKQQTMLFLIYTKKKKQQQHTKRYSIPVTKASQLCAKKKA